MTLCSYDNVPLGRRKEHGAQTKARGSFEQVVMHIENGDVLDLITHHNQKKYPNQRVLVVNINDYAYAVPFVEHGQERFLKTIVPNRASSDFGFRA